MNAQERAKVHKENSDAERNRRADAKARLRKIAQDRQVASKTISKGVLIVYTGTGKGKSTAAFGLAARALGHGMKVGILQFTKGKWRTGEKRLFAGLEDARLLSMGDGFTWETQDRAGDVRSARKAWRTACVMMEESRATPPAWDLLIFDELNHILRYGYLPIPEVVDALRARPPRLHVVVTGRNAPPALLEAADTVSDMRCVRHAYRAGVKAQKGIEF